MGLARRNYQRIWKQDRRYFGAKGQPAPRVVLNVKGGDYTAPGPDGTRTISLSQYTTKELLSQKRKWQNEGRFTIEHELARVFGPDKPLATGTPNQGAGLANAVPNRLARSRNAQGPARRVATRKVRRYNRNHLPYYGQDPTQIKWPMP
jgi:hypothetical protein